jgi:hypothetical protein
MLRNAISGDSNRRIKEGKMKFKKLLLISMIFFATVLIIECAGMTIPQSKSAYVGIWETRPTSPTYMYLAITSNGQIKYSRKDPSRSVSLTGSIQEWKGNTITVAVLVSTTDFIVQKAPYRAADGRQHMVVDGVEMVKK